MKKIYYKVIGTDGKQSFLVPVKIIENITRNNFGRKDCIITPVGGVGTLKVDYLKLIIR